MNSLPFPIFADAVRALYRPPMRRPATSIKMSQVLDELSSLGIATTADLTPATIGRFCQSHPTRSKATLRGLLSYARAACNLAVEWGQLDASPFSRRFQFVRGKGKPRKTIHHSAEQIDQVLRFMHTRRFGWLEHRTYTLISTLAFTGLRRNEALHLRREDIDQNQGIIRIEPTRENPLKTEESENEIPAPALLCQSLNEWTKRTGSGWIFPKRDGSGPWINGTGRGKPTEAVKAAGAAAGVAGFTPLSLRHSFATIAVTWGLTPIQIQQCLRHSNQRTQETYRHNEIRELSRLMQNVSFAKENAQWPRSPSPHGKKHG